MTTYTKITAFAIKDSMADNNPLKVVRGKEFDDEFDSIAASMAEQAGVVAALVTVPVASVVMHAAPTVPDGFLVCDGSLVSRSTYNALFLAIGGIYGVGDGSTTFALPNFSGRFPYGGTLGQLGGSADSIVPYHDHSASTTVYVADPGHGHTLNQPIGGGWNAFGGESPPNTFNRNIDNLVVNPATTGITATASTSVAANGTSVTNANLPPFIGIRFIIKT